MRPVRVVALAGLAALVGGSALGQARVPATVMTHLRSLESLCRSSGGQPGGGRFIIVQDFTGDRRPDYLISEGDFVCTGRPDLFKRGGEARVDIFVGDASGQARRVYSDRLIAFRVLAGAPAKVQIARRGAVCGPAAGPTTQCAAQLAWNGQSFGAEVSVSDADRTGPGSATGPAPVPSAAATPVSGGEVAFLARCRRDLIARDAGATRWADDQCRDVWRTIQAAGPVADALIAALPAPGQRPTLAELRRTLAGVRWDQASPGQLATGRLGGLSVAIEGAAAPVGISVSWQAVGEPVPYDVVGALEQRGARMDQMSCQKLGTGEGERNYAGTLPGRAPFTASVFQRTAPTGNTFSAYSITVSLDGRHPPRGATAGCDF
jgi:hypothetical protein